MEQVGEKLLAQNSFLRNGIYRAPGPEQVEALFAFNSALAE
jgi:hypothetical protein